MAEVNALVEAVDSLVRYVGDTDHRWTRNFKPGVNTHPIPFFGDITNAEIITIGLNPSATEFEGRGWPDHLTAVELSARLLNYFKSNPHQWFDGWEAALGTIGASYCRNAAHLDLSPRATSSAGDVPERDLFEDMLSADLPWMMRFLGLAPAARLVLLAGTASKKYYLNEFIKRELPLGSGRLDGKASRPPGSGKVLRHALVFDGRRLPVWFCSSGPSDRRQPGLLLERMTGHADWLRKHLSPRAEPRQR